jgi:putative transcriptional regulator
MIKIHLSKLLGERKMTQSDLAKITGIRPNTINEWYHEIIVRINVEHIDRICEALNIHIDELIEYIPNKQSKTGKSLIIEDHGNRKSRNN